MGAIISRFKKEKTTYEILENLDEKIKDIEAYTISTQAKQKRFVANFLVISIVLYVLASLIFYFVFFPPTWNERIIHSLPLLICPMIITLIKKGLAWYFQRKVISNTNELKELRAEKKKILEKVMDKETYKVAVEILNKFGDKALKAQMQPIGGATPLRVPQQPQQQAQMTPRSAAPIRPQLAAQKINPAQLSTPLGNRQMLATPIGFNVRPPSPPGSLPQQSGGVIHRPIGMYPQQTVPYRRTPYPIINHSQKGVLEKMVDYLVGEGPNSRFAMICKECLMHNGMALQDEYEYAAFRCAFCGAINPSKKQRPLAPKIPYEQAQLDKLSEKHGSTSSLAESTADAEVENISAEVEEASDKEEETETLLPEDTLELEENTQEETAADHITSPDGDDDESKNQEITPASNSNVNSEEKAD